MSNPNVDHALSASQTADTPRFDRFRRIGSFSEEQLRRIHRYMAKVSDGADRLCTGCGIVCRAGGDQIPEIMACVQDERHGFAVSLGRATPQETRAIVHRLRYVRGKMHKLPIAKIWRNARQRFATNDRNMDLQKGIGNSVCLKRVAPMQTTERVCGCTALLESVIAPARYSAR